MALPPIEAGMDKVAVTARYRAALITANHNIDGVAQCIAEIDQIGKN
ncbi:hypothetical protein ACQR1W_31095 [Bradyrhizobium sp. HKCCYLS1011]